MVNAIYENYDRLNFRVVSWAYWHAITATPHIAAAHFGAALESSQRAYLRSQANPMYSKVVDDETWSKIRTSLETSLDDAGLPREVLDRLKDKIRSLYNKSQHSTGKDLIDKLGLVLSQREKRAHDARHASAHGKDDKVDIGYIRARKLLRIRFYRILLSMTGAHDWYYDYYTLNNPARRVEKPVPDLARVVITLQLPFRAFSPTRNFANSLLAAS